MAGELELNKIYNMDCLEGMKQIDDNSIDMVLCDLPYKITQNKWDIKLNLHDLFKEYWRILKDDGNIVLTAVQPFTTALINTEPTYFRYELIWEKSKATGFLNANRIPLRSHENILIFYKKIGTYNPQFKNGTPYNKGLRKKQDKEDTYGQYQQTIVKSEYGKRYPRSVLYFKTPESEGVTFHKTQKPIKLFEYLIKTYTNKGNLVLDNCIGSGTTAVVCKQTGRHFIGFEIESEYVKIANERLKMVCNIDEWI